MSFDPQKTIIGLIDFFSIVLLGALLTYLLMSEVCLVILENRYANFSGAHAWDTIRFASYLFGYQVIQHGNWLDEVYNWIQRDKLNTQVALFASKDLLQTWPFRALIWLVFKGERNLAVTSSDNIRQHALDTLQAKETINTFQWGKAWLNAENPANTTFVQHLEDDSKFFRCIIFMLLFILAVWPWQFHWPLASIPVVLVLLRIAHASYQEARTANGKSRLRAEWIEATYIGDTTLLGRLTAETARKVCLSLKVAILPQEFYARIGKEASHRPYTGAQSRGNELCPI